MRRISGKWLLRHRTRAITVLVAAHLALFACGDAVAAEAESNSLANRHRIEFTGGYWDSGYDRGELQRWSGWKSDHVEDVLGSFSYSYWVHDQLATCLTFRFLLADATSIDRDLCTSDEYYVMITSAMLGARFYGFSSHAIVRPYVTAGVGPYIGIEDDKVYGDCIVKTTEVLGTFGGHVGVGLDIQMGRYFMLGINTGYNLMVDFPDPLAGEDNFSGVELGAGISLLI